MPRLYHEEVLFVTEEGLHLGAGLARARERAGFSQEEVAVLIGQPRPVISNWESGKKHPNAQQLAKLAAVYRVPVDELIGQSERPRPDFERLLFRDAGQLLDARGKYEIQRFLAFLDDYGAFLGALGEPPGLSGSPLSLHEGFAAKEDIRRKAAEARSYLGLGDGPVADLAGLADLHGISVYHAPLGRDLKGTVSGAFLPHDRVGFSILVNAETTPGRRQFTLAHEMAHALFHGTQIYIAYYGRREGAERFANAFAAEFLVPAASLRAAVESLGLTKVKNPEVVIHLQRLFRVSYAMILRRLEAANLVTASEMERFREVRPLHLAEELGYSTSPDEWDQNPDRWGLGRFPRRFLRLLRRALDEESITISGAASMTGLAQEDIEEFLTDRPTQEEDAEEFEYFGQPA